MSGRSPGCLYGRRGLRGHGLLTWALSLGFQLLLCKSRSACEDVVRQHMLAQVFRCFGMIFTRTGIAFPNSIRTIAVALAGNGTLTIGSNGQIAIKNDLDSPFHSPIQSW